MMTGGGRTPGVMRTWGHAVLWVLMMLALVVFVIAGISTLQSAASGGVPPDPDSALSFLYFPANATYFVGTAVFLLVLFGIWSRYWFLPSDLTNLIEAGHGSTVERRGRVRTSIKARMQDLWLLADLDHPVLSYWPSRVLRAGQYGPATRRGLHPRHMHAVARVELVRVGDFSALPEVRFQVTGVALRLLSSPSGYGTLDQALREAAPALAGVHVPITIEIRPQWLRVRVRGGSWLGGNFARRIRAAIAFAEALVAALEDQFVPDDPDTSTVVIEHGELRIVQDTRFQTIRLEAMRAVADDRDDG